jgi:hypothetical protein
VYSQEEINSAVAAGALSQDAAEALRAHVVTMRERPVTDEEHFRLVNSFNDIFVAIGVIIMLLAAGAIGQAIGSGLVAPAVLPNWDTAGEAERQAWESASMLRNGVQMALAGVAVAVTAWMLAEFFTRKRRMALPSILLLMAFVGGVLPPVSAYRWASCLPTARWAASGRYWSLFRASWPLRAHGSTGNVSWCR